MKLHKWPYWLKGGLLAVALPFVAQEIFHVVTGNYLSLPLDRFFSFLPNIGMDLLDPLFCQAGDWRPIRCIFVRATISGILFHIQFFILGALLGWLYGKIKNRKVAV